MNNEKDVIIGGLGRGLRKIDIANAILSMESMEMKVDRAVRSVSSPWGAGQPGHGRPSVNRPKKNKNFGKNKKKRK